MDQVTAMVLMVAAAVVLLLVPVVLLRWMLRINTIVDHLDRIGDLLEAAVDDDTP